MSLIDPFKWRGPEQVYKLPWIKNRIEYTSDPERVASFAKCPFTRSKLTMNMLTRYHLSNNSIVVSDDEYAAFMRDKFFRHLSAVDSYPKMARSLIDNVFDQPSIAPDGQPIRLSAPLIREVYKNILINLLGIEMTRPLAKYIEQINFQPGRRPMHLSAMLYTFSRVLPGSDLLRNAMDLFFYKGERYTRKVARELEEMIFQYSTPIEGSWYAELLEMKRDGRISNAHFRGEVTSMFVSAYTLSASLSSMILCYAARPEYIPRLRDDGRFRDCFVNEVLRMYPSFRQFGYEHKGTCEKTHEGDHSTDFMIAAYALHRNETAWAAPMEFQPERFLEPGARKGRKFLPFGIGKRYCTGRHFSTQLMAATLAYLSSEECKLSLSVPDDYVGDDFGMPIGISGRLISFPYDDRVSSMSL